HADDPSRAVLAARALQPQFGQHDVKHAMGIATGTAFCGVVGGAARREYTVLGDTVNLAARLMQAAPGDVLCDGVTASRSRAQLAWAQLPHLTVKGKAQPVPVFRPVGEVRPETSANAPLLGRAKELAVLEGALTAARAEAPASPIWIEGEAGVGKSR